MNDTTESQVTWEQPQSLRRPRRDWDGPAAELKEHPNEWAKLDENSTTPGLTYHIKNGHLKAFRPSGAFEARSTKNADGTYDIFARFVGEDQSDRSEVSDFLR